MRSHFEMPNQRERVVKEDEEDDFDMFEEERENGSSSNNLTFYPYSNHKLTRSVGTLNLSLSTTELPTNVSKKLGDIEEEEEEDGGSVDECITRWSPFNDDNPSTPTTLKGVASKNELSPFVNDPDILKKWNHKPATSHLAKSWKAKEDERKKDKDIENIPPRNLAIPDPSAFLAPTGLVSKMTQAQSSTSFPKKLSIPDTPVKKSPLMENSRVSNYIGESPNFSTRSSITQDTSLFMQSPSYRTIPQVLVDASPLSSFYTNTDDNKHAKIRPQKLPPQFHVSRYKKVKKARNSIILKNSELTNSLQQFTDDLYGTENSDFQRSEDEIRDDDFSFFNNFPPPGTHGPNTYYSKSIHDNESSCSSADTTPTRKKSILGAKEKAKARAKAKAKLDSNPTNETLIESSPSQTRRYINAKVTSNPDSHLFEKFSNVSTIGDGQFSTVYQVTFIQTNKRYAVKAIQPNKYNSMKRIMQEIKLLSEIGETILDEEGKEYVIDFISSWKYQNSFYIMTEFCENGNLDGYLREQIIAKNTRLEDWRIWKIIVELSLALRFIHDSCHIVHLDLKPANIMITFEGNLKLGDFGMATHLPLQDLGFENEGDREYIAPEIISDCIYDYRADIFSLGLMIVEIAANVVLPDNGNAWHKLRSGDLSDAGRLSSTDIHSESLFSDNSKVDTNLTEISDYHTDNSLLGKKPKIPAWVPKFLIDGESLERMVKWMIEPNYKRRPSANEILHVEECIYVEMTRKAGAIIQEDDYGPKPEIFIS